MKLEDVSKILRNHLGSNDETRLLNIYLVGSRLYGTATASSDFDFLAIMKDFKSINGEPFEYIYTNNYDIGIYDLNYWDYLIHLEHEVFAILCNYLPTENVS